MTTETLLYIAIAIGGVALCLIVWTLATLRALRKNAPPPEINVQLPPPPAEDGARAMQHEHNVYLKDADGNTVNLADVLTAFAQSLPAPSAAPVMVAAPAPVAPVCEPEADAAPAEDEEAVVFEAERKSLTLDEKYAELSPAERDLYNAVVAKAAAAPGAKRFKNARYEEYKCGKIRLVRLQIKRGVIVCEFILYNDDFKAYISENKLKIKPAPTVIRVVDAASLQIALDSIDMVVDDVEAEKEYKRQQAREKRRAARVNEK